MKTRKIFFPVRLWALVATLMLSFFVSCDKDNDDDDINNTPYTISGSASGTQVVPSVTGTGSGSITGTYDPASRQFNYTTTWTGLTGAPTVGGFYSGPTGTNGVIVGSPWSFEGGATGTGTMSGTLTLTELQAAELTGGGWYYSYGTATNPAGEVRSQISATR